MKPGKYVTRITMIVIFVGIVAYFALYIWQSVNSVVEVTTAASGTVEDTAEVSGFLVREEYVIDEASSSLMEVLLSEGEKVAMGGAVALVYSSEEAVQQQQELETLENQLEQLQELSDGNASSDIVALEEDIEEMILQIHQDISEGSFTSLNEDTESLATLILQQNYYSEDSEDLDSAISELANEIAVLESSISSSTRTVTAEVSGTYSGYVDGYESLLTVDLLDDVTPSTVEEWEELSATVTAEQYIGKLIGSLKWYFVAVMDADEASRMEEGEDTTLRFTGDFSESITMEVESISEEEDGQVAVVLSTYDYLTETTTLRYQAADIVYDRTTGIEVPLSALHIETSEDEDGNTVSQTGLYVVVGGVAEWKEVNVLYTGEDTCIVESTDSTDSDALREGDTVISKGKNIYDGKVISE